MRNKFSFVSDPSSFVSDPGSPIKTLYSPSILPDGVLKLTPYDQINIQEEIDSYRDSCDMAFILNRLLNGDNSVLNQSHANYGDFTDMPKTMAEAMQLTMDAEAAFGNLPREVQAAFEFNYRRWVMEAGSESWMKTMSSFVSPSGSSEAAASVVTESEVADA